MEASELQFHKEPWYKNFNLLILFGFLFFVMEFFIKHIASSYWFGEGINLGIFNLRFVPNEAMAFSLPIHPAIIVIASGAIILGLVNYMITCCKNGCYNQMWAMNFVIWAAFSNFYDRITRGFVVDYIDIGFWPVFNLSDIVIVGGLVSVLIMMSEREKQISFKAAEA